MKASALDELGYIHFKGPVNLPTMGEVTSWSRGHARSGRVELADSPRPGRIRFYELNPDGERTGIFTDVPVTNIDFESGRLGGWTPKEA